MAGKRGYEAVRILRARPQEKRGGQDPMPEHFDKDGLTLAVYADRFLERLRMLNRTPKAVRSHWHGVKYFLRWAQERDLVRPRQVTHTILQG